MTANGPHDGLVKDGLSPICPEFSLAVTRARRVLHWLRGGVGFCEALKARASEGAGN